jgi:hypothetical protein
VGGSWGRGRGLTAWAHPMGAGAAVAGEGMGLIRGGHESARERAGERGTVLTGRSHWAENESASGRGADRWGPLVSGRGHARSCG